MPVGEGSESVDEGPADVGAQGIDARDAILVGELQRLFQCIRIKCMRLLEDDRLAIGFVGAEAPNVDLAREVGELLDGHKVAQSIVEGATVLQKRQIFVISAENLD